MPSKLQPRHLASLLGALIGGPLLLSGCAVGPDFLRPLTSLPERFHSEATAPEQAEALPAPLDPNWWTLFQDQTLDDLVTRSLADNQSLAAAVARVENAEAAARAAGADFYPAVSGDFSNTRNRTSAQSYSGLQSGGSAIYNDHRAALDISYEVDLWGKLRRTSEAARATALASRFEQEALRLSVSAQVATEYLNLRSLDVQVAVTADSQASRERTLQIVQGRLDAGAASPLDLAQAQGNVAAMRAQLVQLQRQRAISEHQLALLTGQPGLTVAAGDITKLPVPLQPPAGLPSSLLDNRPDVRQAEETLVASNARIGVAKSAYFPTISLTGAAGSESEAMSKLFGSGAGIWSLGVDLAMPIFNAGKTGDLVAEATATQKESLADYRLTVQTAFKEVNDALSNLRGYTAEEEAQAAQLTATKQALKIAQGRYEAGYIGFLDVLDAQRTNNTAQIAYLSARQNHLGALVDLFKALGGGWREEGKAAPPAAVDAPQS
jgi:outer membrane protein, multidrug efflux system